MPHYSMILYRVAGISGGTSWRLVSLFSIQRCAENKERTPRHDLEETGGRSVGPVSQETSPICTRQFAVSLRRLVASTTIPAIAAASDIANTTMITMEKVGTER